jgi:hypothetical protein
MNAILRSKSSKKERKIMQQIIANELAAEEKSPLMLK